MYYQFQDKTLLQCKYYFIKVAEITWNDKRQINFGDIDVIQTRMYTTKNRMKNIVRGKTSDTWGTFV